MHTKTAHCPLPTAHCPLPTAHCPLPTAHCPLPLSTSHSPARSQPRKSNWGRADKSVVDLWRFAIDSLEQIPTKARNQARQTQVLASDPAFRITQAEKKSQLVQLADGSWGWILTSEIQELPTKNYWQKIQPAEPKKLAPLPQPSRQKIQQAIQKYAQTPYLWGGNSPAGLDCSAFVQRVVYSTTGLLLPRNSRVQRTCGQRVRQAELTNLDLVFFVHQTKGLSHVGLYFDQEVWHFCLDARGLAHEPLSQMKKRYHYKTARRIYQSQC